MTESVPHVYGWRPHLLGLVPNVATNGYCFVMALVRVRGCVDRVPTRRVPVGKPMPAAGETVHVRCGRLTS
jgi:hypothetical protein